MVDYIIIWFSQRAELVRWQRVSMGQPWPDWQQWAQGSLAEAAGAVQGATQPLILLIPGVEVMITQVAVPSRQREVIRQAVPALLEDMLIEDIEQIHFALGKINRHTGQALVVNLIAHTRMQHYQQLWQSVGLKPAIVMADSACLAPMAETVQMAVQGEETDMYSYSLLRINEQQPCAVYTQQLPALLSALQAEMGAAWPSSILAENVPSGLMAATTGKPCWKLPSRLADYNLLQGEYMPARPRWMMTPYAWTALLLILISLAKIGFLGMENYQLRQQQAQLKQQTEQLYRQFFPGARKIVNARAQMAQALQAMPTGSSAGFLDLLAQVVVPLNHANPAQPPQIQQLQYQDSRLDIRVQAVNIQILEHLKQTLAALPGLRVELQAVTAQGAGKLVEGRLQIRKGI